MQRAIGLLHALLGILMSVSCRTAPPPPTVQVAEKAASASVQAPAEKPKPPAEKPKVSVEKPKTPEKAVPRKSAPKARTSFTDAELSAFATSLVESLNKGKGKDFSLTYDELLQIHPKAIAAIVQTGTDQWLNTCLLHFKGGRLTFKQIQQEAQFAIEMLPPKNATQSATAQPDIPQVTHLAIEILVDGNPHRMVIENMYYVNDHWKVFKINIDH